MKYDKNYKILFLGHHKCASTWMFQILAEIATQINVGISQGNENNSDLIHVYSNSSINSLSSYTNYKAIHLIRDPRDVVVSGYHSHKTSHWLVPDWKDLHDVRKKLNEIPLVEGIFIEIEFLRKTFNEMYTFTYNDPHILELKFEDIETPEFYSKIYSFLNLESYNFSTEQFNTIVEKNSFHNLSGGRAIGHEDRSSHYRKGLSGEWIQYFSPEIKEYFKSKFGALLVKLGYEEDNDW